jgi:hypothetical protein
MRESSIRRRGVVNDAAEARLVLERKIACGKPEVARVAADVLADPVLFERFVELRRLRRTTPPSRRPTSAAAKPRRPWPSWLGLMVWWRRRPAVA